jgi:ketosteroid isomerase-like protein
MSSSSLSATENTRQFLTDWFARLETSGFDGGVFLGALSDDLIWTATGTSPVSGTFQGKQSYIDNVWRPLDDHLARWPRANVVRILADGEWAVVEFHGVGGLGRNGTDYTLQYCWVVRVVDDLVRAVVGYYDQTKVNELFDDKS